MMVSISIENPLRIEEYPYMIKKLLLRYDNKIETIPFK